MTPDMVAELLRQLMKEAMILAAPILIAAAVLSFVLSLLQTLFGALNSLIADYSSGTVDTTKAVSDTAALGTALNYVSQQRVTIDNSINQISASSQAVSSEQTQLTSAQTNLMQADVAQISTHLSLAETQQTALEDIISQLGSNSLFQKLQG